MTITALTPKILWVGSGSTDSQTLTADGQPLVFSATSEIVVRQLNTSSGDEAVMQLGTDYTLSGYPVTSAGPAATLTRIAGNLPSGYTWAVTRVTAATQPVDLVSGGDFSSSDVESMGDRATRQIQEIKEQLARALLLSLFSDGVSAELPDPQALNYLRWNAAANALENAASVDLTGTTVSSFIENLLDDANAAAARTTLGLGALAVLDTIATGQVDNDAITYAKLQNIATTQRLLGRNTAGSGDAEEVTLSQLLDWIGSAAQGDILYRGASAWARLGAGTAKMALLTGGAGANPSWGYAPGTLIAIIEDVKAQNTSGGTFTAGADQTRTLNTLVYNRDTLVSLSGGTTETGGTATTFTLPAGTWEIAWDAPAHQVDAHQSMLYDATGTAILKRGSTERSEVAEEDIYTTRSFGSYVVTPGSANNYQIKHRSGSTGTTFGFGLAANLGVEVYTRVIIRAA
jgi:hypothetical protein